VSDDAEERADEEAAAPHPRETSSFFGHREAEQALLAAYRGGRIPHAVLIGGPQGIGKATLAYRMAKFVLAHPDPASAAVAAAQDLSVDAGNPAARRVAMQSHPDLLTIERTLNDKGRLRQQIAIEDVRRSIAFFGSTAGEGGWRIGIVDALDEMNTAGENALLKILEEPPPRSLLFLVSHSPGGVRATLRSRCRRLMLRPLEEDDVRRAVAAALNRDADDEEIRGAARLADGSVARALSLMDGEVLDLRDKVAALLAQLPTPDPLALHALGEALGGAEQRVMDGVIEALEDWLSAQLRLQTDRARMARMAAAAEEIGRAARLAGVYNLDRKPLIFQTFGLLADAARGC
jgi:DNA polymerase-3 subunit delta'